MLDVDGFPTTQADHGRASILRKRLHGVTIRNSETVVTNTPGVSVVLT
jgi:hypothetical protein